MPAWRKSSHSAAANCVEVASRRKSWRSGESGGAGTVVLMRDTMDRGGPVLVFGPVAWVALLEGLRSA